MPIKQPRLQIIAKILTVSTCLMLLNSLEADSLLLNNLVGCNTFGCRISKLENDVALLMGRVFPNGPPQLNQNGLGGILGLGDFGGMPSNGQSGSATGGASGSGPNNNRRGGGGVQASLVAASGDPVVNSYPPEYQNYNQQQTLRQNPGYFNNQQFSKNQFSN